MCSRVHKFGRRILLTTLFSHRGRQDSAQKLYSHLPAHYVDLRWVKIEASLLKQCTDLLQDRLKMPRERLLSTLALIRAGVELGSKEWDLDAVHEASMRFTRTEDMEKLATQLMKDVYDLSSTLSKGERHRPVQCQSTDTMRIQTLPPSHFRLFQ